MLLKDTSKSKPPKYGLQHSQSRCETQHAPRWHWQKERKCSQNFFQEGTLTLQVSASPASQSLCQLTGHFLASLYSPYKASRWHNCGILPDIGPLASADNNAVCHDALPYTAIQLPYSASPSPLAASRYSEKLFLCTVVCSFCACGFNSVKVRQKQSVMKEGPAVRNVNDP